MKILSYEIKGKMLRVTTDNPGRPDFVYPQYKFNSLAELKTEIELSITKEAERKTAKDLKINTVKNELDGELNG